MLPDPFSFLVICQDVKQDPECGSCIFGIVGNVLVEAFPTTLHLYMVVGAAFIPENSGKRLDLMAFRIGSKGERQRLPGGYVGTQMKVPPGASGAAAAPMPISVPVDREGIYGFELFDTDGCFGPKERQLATCTYSVSKIPDHANLN